MRRIRDFTLNAICAVISLIMASAAIASDKLPIKIEYLNPISIVISHTGINRLHFENTRITKIIGDTSSYTSLLSDNGSDLFLVSKVPAGEVMNLSLLTAKQHAIDLKINISDAPSPVFINLGPLSSMQIVASKERQEISDMMTAMMRGTKDKYYVEASERAVNVNTKPELMLKQYTTYRYLNLMGAGFECSNINAKLNQTITSDSLARLFDNVLAVSIDNPYLKPGRNTKVFVVCKVEQDDV